MNRPWTMLLQAARKRVGVCMFVLSCFDRVDGLGR